MGISNWRIRLQHGQNPESVLFTANVIVATIDQVITSYACTPLTLPVRHGNIPAGAVMSSFLVFDEVHLFDPHLALQAMRLICERLYRLGLPFAILSATLPDVVAEFWKERFDCEVVEASQDPIQRKLRLEWKKQPLIKDAIWQAFREGRQRIVAVCNTVERALGLYEEVQSIAQKEGYECQLFHSRFLPDDRRKKEEWVTKHFGKNAVQDTKSLLIATQVVEAGLDISCDCLLTELAPVDALIQRAGRCARWGGEGVVRVYEVKKPTPYEKDLVENTRQLLAQQGCVHLTWDTAKAWVNQVLNDRYKGILSEGSVEYERVVAQLSFAGFTGSRARAEEAVRDVHTVEVSIHSNPGSLKESVLRLPTINVHIGIARRWLKASKQPVWRVEVDPSPSDAGVSVNLEQVREGDLRIGDRLIFPPSVLRYDDQYGLHEGSGEDFRPLPLKERPKLEEAQRKEKWIDHAIETVKFARGLLDCDQHAVEGLSRILGVSSEEIRKGVILAAVLHDLGKLTVGWQKRAGVGEAVLASDLLAHTDERIYEGFPPHATVSAYALWDALTESAVLPRMLGRAIAFAIAHHHSVRAQQVPKYELHPQWQSAVQQALSQAGVNHFPLDKVVVSQPSGTALRDHFPPLEYERLYTAYVLVARWLRLADRMATGGGEDALFRYEDWFGGL